MGEEGTRRGGFAEVPPRNTPGGWRKTAAKLYKVAGLRRKSKLDLPKVRGLITVPPPLSVIRKCGLNIFVYASAIRLLSVCLFGCFYNERLKGKISPFELEL